MAISLQSESVLDCDLGRLLVERLGAVGCAVGPLAAVALHEVLLNAVIHGNLEVSSGAALTWDDLARRQERISAALGDPARAARVVSVAVGWDVASVRVVVTDQGEGYRAAAGRPVPDGSRRGAGRGLAVARAAGRLQVLRGGSRARLTLARLTVERQTPADPPATPAPGATAPVPRAARPAPDPIQAPEPDMVPEPHRPPQPRGAPEPGRVPEPGSVPDPIIVLDPDPAEARQIADWLRSAGLGMISTARTCDEAIFMLGRQNAGLLIIDAAVPDMAERRLLRHMAMCGHGTPITVRLLADAAATERAGAPPRAVAAEILCKPLNAHDVVVRVGTAMQRPDLLGHMDRGRDQSAEHLAAARRMQVGLLPTPDQLVALQAECGVGLDGFCHSGEAVGGDFWGAWPTGDGRFALALADFAGHGLSAALNTFRLHAILSQRTLPRGLPKRMLALLNQRLHALLPRGHYATMVYAHIDPVRHGIEWSSAGGPPPIVVDADGARDLPGRGLPLGVRRGTLYQSAWARLPERGIVCLFSDGLYESGPGSPDVPRAAIAAALGDPLKLAASGRLEEASRLGTAELAALRDRHRCLNHSDDVMAVCVALGPAARGP